MQTNLFRKTVLSLTIICLPLFSMAWGAEGHRICGQIADSYLTPKARKAVLDILNSGNDYLGFSSVAIASTWADFIKSDPNFSYLSTWHYIDFDKPYSLADMNDFLAHDTNTDAYTKLQFLIGELKKKDITKQNRLLYLRMLIHIVEDVHQPMHTGRTTDQGGNGIKLTWNNQPSNLHSVWDSEIINSQQLSYTEYAASINHTSAAQRAEWQKAPISQWLFESNQLAEKIYDDTKNGDNLGSYKYVFKYLDTVNLQLVKGGVRLAGVLNELFG